MSKDSSCYGENDEEYLTELDWKYPEDADYECPWDGYDDDCHLEKEKP